MRRILATVTAAAAVFGGSIVASAPAQALGCTYRVDVPRTHLYENRSWDRNGGFWDVMQEGTLVQGPCGSSGGWTPILRVKWQGEWVSVQSFKGDIDFMRTWTLDYQG